MQVDKGKRGKVKAVKEGTGTGSKKEEMTDVASGVEKPTT